MAVPFLLFSCSSKTKNDESKLLKSEEVLQTITPVEETIASFKFEIVSNEKVCMVNDRYMYVDQMPVEVDGITYYGCCENCVIKIQQNINDVRYAETLLPVTRLTKHMPL